MLPPSQANLCSAEIVPQCGGMCIRATLSVNIWIIYVKHSLIEQLRVMLRIVMTAVGAVILQHRSIFHESAQVVYLYLRKWFSGILVAGTLRCPCPLTSRGPSKGLHAVFSCLWGKMFIFGKYLKMKVTIWCQCKL